MFKKKIIVFILLCFMFSLAAGCLPLAKETRAASWLDKQDGLDDVSKSFGGSSKDDVTDVREITALVINVFLGFLGIIFVILLVLAGYKWMMAQGNEQDIEEAQAQIKMAVIGIIIILAAYGIAEFVFEQGAEEVFDIEIDD